MNVQRVRAVVAKEWREIVRDPLFLSLSFVVPAMLMLLFGYGLSLDVENIPFAIVDYDDTALSRDYAYRYTSSRYFDFQGYSRDEELLAERLSTNEIRAWIVIPEHFERELLAGQPVAVQTLLDGTFPSRAATTKGYVSAINAAYSQELLASYLGAARGMAAETVAAALQPIGLGVRYLYNQSLSSTWSIAPKLIMVILMVSPPFLTSLGVVREKERGSIYNIYASTVSRGEFLIGKITPYVLISLGNAVVLWLLATRLFGAPFKGDLAFLLVATAVYVVCTTGIGLVISVLVRTQVAAMVVTAIATVVPSVLYSGVLVPIPSLSGEAQVIAHLLPAMYYAEIVTNTFLKGAGFGALWQDLLVLVAYATVLFAVGYRLFSKRPAA